MKKGDIKKWRGIINSDTGLIDGGYLWIVTKVDKDKKNNVIGYESKGIAIDNVSNRSQAIKKYNLNPENPNNYNYVK